MRVGIFAILTVVAFLAGSISGQQLVFTGVAGAQCGNIVDLRAKQPNEKIDEMIMWWGVGFLDGGAAVLGRPRTRDSARTVLSKLSDYCWAHKDETMADAAVSLLLQLPTK